MRPTGIVPTERDNPMRKLCCPFILLLAFSCVIPLNMGAATGTQAPYAVEYECADELITPYYHLYGKVLGDFVVVRLTNRTDAFAQFLMESEIDGYGSSWKNTVQVPPGETAEVRQNPRLIPESIALLNVQRYANLSIRVTLLNEGEDELLLSESKEILLYSRRDYAWVQGLDEQQNLDLLASFVMPNDPAVEELLRRAAEYTDSGQIWSGYGEVEHDTEETVWDRLRAVWQAEQGYNLTYISTWVSFTPGASQRMRLPYEVLEQSGGNCIELVFLYASAVEAMDLECAIVLVPGHSYLAVRSDLINESYYFIETTLIGQEDFEGAVESAGTRWEQDGEMLDADAEGYDWVDIEAARAWGIIPVPWR